MNTVKKIMFATDFSKVSREAMVLARQLRDNFGAELDVVHVYDPDAFDVPLPYGMMPGVGMWIDDRTEELKEHGRKALDKLVVEVGDCTTHFLTGRPGPTIVEFTKEHDINMIVMGTHGFKGLHRLLVGSVAEHVLRNADCPVVTVRDGEAG